MAAVHVVHHWFYKTRDRTYELKISAPTELEITLLFKLKHFYGIAFTKIALRCVCFYVTRTDTQTYRDWIIIILIIVAIVKKKRFLKY